MEKLLTIGEAMVLFAGLEEDVPLKDTYNYHKYLAGAEVNVAIGVTRLGHKASYITQLGMDPFGQFIKESLVKNNIDTSYIQETDVYATGFMMKNKVTTSDPDIFYCRKNSAASNIEQATLADIIVANYSFAHFTGIFPAISEKACLTMEHLLKKLKKQQVQITFDPNLRPQLWYSKEKMIQTINAIAREATIILPGVAEGEILTGSSDPEAIAHFYLNQSEITQAVVVKLGSQGAFLKEKGKKSKKINGFSVNHVVDTVGAGDGFAVGLISALMEGKSLSQAVVRANAVGALAVQASGDSEGYPTLATLKNFYEENGVEV